MRREHAGVAKSSRRSQCHVIKFYSTKDKSSPTSNVVANSFSNFSSRKKVDTPPRQTYASHNSPSPTRKTPQHPKSIPQSSTDHASTQRKRNIPITLQQQRLPFPPSTTIFSANSPSPPQRSIHQSHHAEIPTASSILERLPRR